MRERASFYHGGGGWEQETDPIATVILILINASEILFAK